MIFDRESDFEEALIKMLQRNGWEEKVLKYPTEQDLINNWASILFENNRGIDRLNDQPLTETEMGQIMEQIIALKTPIKLNGFINGKTVAITRDNPKDKLHYGKEVSLKIYDRHEIAAGQSRYQIAQQPVFNTKNPVLNNRRGDFMLLINGMPVIHVELKKSGIPISNAYNQIEKYAHEGIFTGIYSLIQVFVAMNPDDCVYFANPGPEGKFNKDFYFHWADFNNEPVNDWKDIAARLLSIPMAHQIIGFYTVADDSDGILKVMRSYQYYAANSISDKVSKIKWEESHQLGGYIWHTTGSGKTMSSFKSAQLIANSKDADKVVFLMDRVELGTQSLYEYRAFSDITEDVQATENTRELISKLKSNNSSDTLIVTSIQKMSRIEEDEDGLNANDIEEMNKKRIVFIVDEAHRSTFGDMLVTVKNTFPRAVFFGFTGTPIYDKNKKKDSTTATIFGNELHRYTIADGIRDKNVLGFDPYKCNTYTDNDIRKAVALEKAKAENEEEIYDNENKKEVFFKYMNDIPMAGYEDKNGIYHKGIEDFVKNVQYDREEHRKMVVKDIFKNWITLSQNGKFHAIFATSSIPEAIKYYRLIKEERPNLKTTVLVDANIDNSGDKALFKEDGLVEIIEDYNKMYGMEFGMAKYDKFKKDISARLSHKRPYERIELEKDKQLDILIVVDQMLTGFDSKWVNTLYLDKILQYENIIQAFSRTNRLFGPDKPFGIIRYYRKPNTMQRNIEDAVKYYSGDREVDLFVEKLPYNLKKMIEVKEEIDYIFKRAGVNNFEKLPDDITERGQFAKFFKEFNGYLESAKIQGFKWDRKEYIFEIEKKEEKISFDMDEQTYLTLVQRYKELATQPPNKVGDDVAYDIDGYLTEIDTGKIDTNYMNSRFEKYLKDLEQENISPEELQKTLNELHKSFAKLSQEEQKFANIFLHDVESGEAQLVEGKKFRDYITDYQLRYKSKQIIDIHNAIGVDIDKLEKIMKTDVNEGNINEFGRFIELENTIDKNLAKKYFEKINGKKLPPFKVTINASKLLREFILSGGFDICNDEQSCYQITEESLKDIGMVAENE